MLGRISPKVVVPAILAALFVLGTAASAMPAAAERDFAPFTVQEEYWTAEMVHYPDGRTEPGSSTYQITYASRDRWHITQLTHSYEPERGGTTWDYAGGTLTQYDALRKTTRILPRPDAVDNWIQIGQLTALTSKFGATVRDDAMSDRREISWSVMTASGATSRTVAAFSRTTHLPLLVEDWNGSTLVRRITFTSNAP